MITEQRPSCAEKWIPTATPIIEDDPPNCGPNELLKWCHLKVALGEPLPAEKLVERIHSFIQIGKPFFSSYLTQYTKFRNSNPSLDVMRKTILEHQSDIQKARDVDFLATQLYNYFINTSGCEVETLQIYRHRSSIREMLATSETAASKWEKYFLQQTGKHKLA
jgi:hypothetical protein